MVFSILLDSFLFSSLKNQSWLERGNSGAYCASMGVCVWIPKTCIQSRASSHTPVTLASLGMGVGGSVAGALWQSELRVQ